MEINQLATTGALAITCFGAIGATVRWAYREFRVLGSHLERVEKENLLLIRLYGQLKVRLERVRLAFDMVDAELSTISPQSHALSAARRIFREAFPVDPETPEEMDELLRFREIDDERPS